MGMGSRLRWFGAWGWAVDVAGCKHSFQAEHIDVLSKRQENLLRGTQDESAYSLSSIMESCDEIAKSKQLASRGRVQVMGRS